MLVHAVPLCPFPWGIRVANNLPIFFLFHFQNTLSINSLKESNCNLVLVLEECRYYVPYVQQPERLQRYRVWKSENSSNDKQGLHNAPENATTKTHCKTIFKWLNVIEM